MLAPSEIQKRVIGGRHEWTASNRSGRRGVHDRVRSEGFFKSGASQQEFVTDRYSCDKDAHQSAGFGTGLAGAIAVNNFFESCMNAHGWYVQQHG